MCSDISGYYLAKTGWERNGSTYVKGAHTLVYDGWRWWLDKEIVMDIPELEQKTNKK